MPSSPATPLASPVLRRPCAVLPALPVKRLREAACHRENMNQPAAPATFALQAAPPPSFVSSCAQPVMSARGRRCCATPAASTNSVKALCGVITTRTCRRLSSRTRRAGMQHASAEQLRVRSRQRRGSTAGRSHRAFSLAQQPARLRAWKQRAVGGSVSDTQATPNGPHLEHPAAPPARPCSTSRHRTVSDPVVFGQRKNDIFLEFYYTVLQPLPQVSFCKRALAARSWLTRTRRLPQK